MAEIRSLREELVPLMSKAELEAARSSLRRVLGAVEKRLGESSQSDSSSSISRAEARELLERMRGGA
jgi:hypothetical protein